MSKAPIKDWTKFNHLLTRRLETGFTVLEAVVVVGVLLAIAVGGFFAYGPIAENAKIAKVKSTASSVHTAVLVAHSDGDPLTQPQDVIDNWNNSTDKIRVEILDPIAPAMNTDGTYSAGADFCVQAVNVKSPHIRAKRGACANVATTTEPDMDWDGIPNATDPDMDGDKIPNETDPDMDGDGIPNESDSDMNGDGTPNTAWESFRIVQASQAAGEEVAYTNSDGSTTTWNYNDTTTYGHEHDPTNPNILPAGKLDILRMEKVSTRQVNVTIGTDGSVTSGDGAVGGSFGAWMHADLTCANTATGVVTPRYTRSGAILKGPYFGNPPGPNTTGLTFACESNETITGVTLFPDRHVDWSDNPYGGYSYFFTRDQIIKWTPAEV